MDHYLVVIPATSRSCFSWCLPDMCLLCQEEAERLAENWDSLKIVVAITASGYLYEWNLRAVILERIRKKGNARHALLIKARLSSNRRGPEVLAGTTERESLCRHA
jgi:hypothetical protein